MIQSFIAVEVWIFILVFGPGLGLSDTNIGTECQTLQRVYNTRPADVIVDGEVKEITILHSPHITHRILANVLQAKIKYILGYRNIILETTLEEENTANKILYHLSQKPEVDYNSIPHYFKIWVSVPMQKQSIADLAAAISWLSVVNLAGDSGAQTWPQMYAALSAAAYNLTTCRTQSWYHYADQEFLKHCHFTPSNNSQEVLTPSNDSKWLEQLKQYGTDIGLNLQMVALTHQNFRQEVLRRISKEQSFLFLDDTPWVKESRIVAFNMFTSNTYLLEFKIFGYILRHHVPEIVNTVQRFYMNAMDVEGVLQKMEDMGDLSEATCNWLLKNNNVTRSINSMYNVTVFICNDDPDINNYPLLLANLKEIVKDDTFQPVIDIEKFSCPSKRSACSDQLKSKLKERMQFMRRSKRLVAVLGPSCGAEVAAQHVKEINLPLLVYEASARESGVLDAVGGEARLWNAARDLLRDMSWSRVALLTDRPRAQHWMLETVTNHTHSILIDQLSNINTVLGKLKKDDARVMLINADWKTASDILCGGAEQGMTSEAGYAWVLLVPRWLGTYPCNAHHLVLTHSYSRRMFSNLTVSDSTQRVRQVLDAVSHNNDGRWPSSFAYVADALVAVAYGYKKLFEKLPYCYDFPRTPKGYRLFKKILGSDNIPGGVIEDYYFIGDQRASSSLVLYARHNGTVETLAAWRVDDKNVTQLYKNFILAFPLGVPTDGKTKCLMASGESFHPQCHDVLGFTLIVLAVAVVTFTVVAFRVRSRYRTERRANLHAEPLAALASLLVERKALVIHEALGTGSYGHVFRATWCQSLRTVAVKTCRSDATDADSERELLQEATLMATLEHANVLRLLGVVADDEPVAVVLEYMFFGDVATYLRARRSLAPDGFGGEAEYVSAVALTSLALQAARALSYLAVERIMHRDVRAANCLLDSRRTLKLADFGLARRAPNVTGTYHSMRRALFPVAWMAPESLTHGAWSSAADVWSFGVLLVELATLGARPYGHWSPARVLAHASAGGRPLLPEGAGPQLRALTSQCWQRSPARRPSAPELVQYLAEHSTAVGPCPAPPEPAELTPDSGYHDIDYYISMHTL